MDIKFAYCWRCQIEIPMLEEHEWIDILGFLQGGSEGRQAALVHYNKITGFDETNPNAIWHHRLSLFGVENRYVPQALESAPYAGTRAGDPHYCTRRRALTIALQFASSVI